MPTVTYQLEPDLAPEEFIDVLVRSTLAERRPVNELDTIRAMLKNADVILTARLDGLLVGVSRAITDFAYCTYLSDLAVDERVPAARHRAGTDSAHARGGWPAHDADPAGSAEGAVVLSARRHDEARFLLGRRPAATQPVKPGAPCPNPFARRALRCGRSSHRRDHAFSCVNCREPIRRSRSIRPSRSSDATATSQGKRTRKS